MVVINFLPNDPVPPVISITLLLNILIIFSTLVLPIEVRVLTTFQVAVSLNWLNSMSGLTIPLMASATAIFLFRQFFHTVPPELLDAALASVTEWVSERYSSSGKKVTS